MTLSIVILAAGEGSRMKSTTPKVLHTLAGRPLLEHVVATAAGMAPQRLMVVYGHGGDAVRGALAHHDVTWVLQSEQLGTGHAVAQALPGVEDDDVVLILYGDVPLVSPETLQRLVAAAAGDCLGLLTMVLEDPAGYGRIIRDAQGNVQRIVEQKDATLEEQQVTEINTGMMAMPAGRLKQWLAAIDNHNAQGEYYLTDVIARAVTEGVGIETVSPRYQREIMGVNDKVQLAQLERQRQLEQAEEVMRAGVTLRDPARFDLRGELSAGAEVVIDIDVIIEGKVVLGEGVYVGPYSVLRDVTLGDGVQVKSHSVIEEAEIDAHCSVGPFARIRPGTHLAAGARIGNFVEIKSAAVGEGSKVNHLSYVGDATVGRDVNIGAGTITCNYDGADKHHTVIGDRAFIGSNSQLVAPVTIGEDATIGAGSTINKDAPAGELTLSRVPQRTRKGWRRPTKDKGKEGKDEE